MGRDKAELEIEGVPLWQRQLATLEQCGAEEIVISAAHGRSGKLGGYEMVADEVEGQGPLRALATVLRRSGSSNVLVIGVDLPAMTAEFLRQLCGDGIKLGSTLIPHDGERLQPLAAFYTRHCLPLIDEQLAGGSFALHSFIEHALENGIAREFSAAAHRHLFVNLNSPEDVSAFSRQDGC